MLWKSAFDIWSAPHFIVGALFAIYIPLDIVGFTFINIGWEIFEWYIKKSPIIFRMFPFLRPLQPQESGINKTVDILLAELGWVLAYYYLHGTWY